MTMSKDDWKAECTKDDDLKLSKAGGNKIRRIMTPPIFSSGMLDILLVEWCYQGRKPLKSSTQSTGASTNPDTLGKARIMKKTHHWAMLLTGESMVMTLKPRTHDKTLQRPHDWDHWHLRMNSQDDTILINILLDLRRKLQYIFGYSKAPRSSDSNESRMKSIEVSHKKLWPKHRKSCTLKFSGQHAALK